MNALHARKYSRIRLKSGCRIDGHGNIRRWYRTCPYRDVYTLNPSNFLKQGQNWIDVSCISNPTIRMMSSTDREFKPVQLPYAMKAAKADSTDVRCLRESWPEYSHGFLYYFSPMNRPQIAGELRLRLTPTNDPSTFNQGKDLCFTKPTLHGAVGQPWKRPLYSIATNRSSLPIYQKLIDEGFIPPQLDKSIKSLPKLTFMYSRCQIIHSLYDTFALDLSSDWVTLVAVAETGIARIHILRQFRDLRSDKIPYSGTILARFEPSGLPEHANTRTVLLRVVQEITPVQCHLPSYDQYIQRPTAGHLFAKNFHGKLRPWSVDIDKGRLATTGLKLIWGSTPGLEQRD